ncbi:response regulator transcription factor [Kineosporia succinea]|uniref:DNA-binding CsgD family transcriptional regulator n=1 Tax=Kineosporia succinea TaxID=84632 RepID=A0ABT9P8Z5_9ACTN|nr:helix-turn-helix transcriptional regulator [Kineosporia succinea]MDP9829180.1 DNA-binding CsgD family transcriptional regulator [Kineosporia succinea]
MTVTSAQLDDTRQLFAQLRCRAGATRDPEVRQRLLRRASVLLEALGSPGGASGGARRGHIYPQHLTGREIDVLAVVGIGATNSEAAERLGVTTETVKGYLRTAMHKLQATNRYSAVQSARQHRFIP